MIHTSVNLRVTCEGCDFSLEEEAGRIMDELLKLEECNDDLRDSGVAADLEEQTITLDIAVDTMDSTHAFKRATIAFRTAVHATGGATPDWPTSEDIDDSMSLVYREQRFLMERTPSLAASS